MKIIKVTPIQPANVKEFYINSNYIVHFSEIAGGTQINVLEAGNLIPYLISETPEQLMDALREETFPVEYFLEELTSSDKAIHTEVFGHVSTN